MANVSVGNTTGLYIGSGQSRVLTNAQQLLSLLSNNGGVTFALDPAFGNARVEAFSSSFSNANIATYLPTYTGLLGGTLTTAGQPNITSVGTLTSLTATGNITTSNYFIGDGSQLTNLPLGNYGNANVSAFLPTYTGNLVSLTGNVTTTANISGAYIKGNGSQLTGITTNYSNANVSAFLPTYTGNLVSLTGAVTTTANITGAYIFGNGSQLTGLAATYGNANVAAYLPTYTGNLVSLTGNVITTANVTGAYILGNGSQLTGLPATYSNANVAAYLPTYTGNLVSLTGNVITTANVSAAYLLGNGSAITGLTTTQVTEGANLYYTNARARAAITVTSNSGTYTDSNITYNSSTGVITYNEPSYVSQSERLIVPVKNTSGGTLTKGTPVYPTGTVGVTDTFEVSAARADTASTMPPIGLLESDLAVNATGYAIQLGLISSVNTSAYAANQILYVAATGGLTGTRPTGANLVQPLGTVGRVNASTGSIVVNIWNYLQVPNLGNGNIWIGNASAFPSEVNFNTQANSAIGAYLPTYTGLLGGTLTTATQPNITSVGTLTSVTTSGNVNAVYANISATVFAANIVTGGTSGNITGANYINANFFVGNGSLLTGISTSNYGNANVAAFLPTYTGNLVSLTGNVTTTANVQAAYFIGNGSALTGITATASPGGADTQLQYNDAGSLNGNTALTFSKVNGNIRLGNLYVNNGLTNNDVEINAQGPLSTATQSTSAFAGNVVVVGDGARTITPAIFNAINPGLMGSKLLVSETLQKAGNDGLRNAGIGIGTVVNFTSNITSTNTRYNGFVPNPVFGGNITQTAGGWFSLVGQASTPTAGGGSGAGAPIGNVQLQYLTGVTTAPTVSVNSTTGNVFGYVSAAIVTSNNQVGTYMGYTGTMASTGTGVPGNVYLNYNPSTTNTYGINHPNNLRQANNYYYIFNEDDVSQVRLGSLRRYTEYRANTSTTTGTVTVNKTDAQVQYLVPTGNCTIQFAGFVPSASDSVNTDWQSDTVTLVIAQGATPYTITMPSGNTAVKYAGNVSTVANTANAVTMISTTAMTIGGSTTYLVTISPEFI